MKTNLSEGFGIIATHCFDANRNMLPPTCGLDNYDESRNLFGVNDWRYFEFTVTADMPEAAFLQVQCYASPGALWGSATGTIWCDDFKVKEIGKTLDDSCGEYCVEGTPSGKCLKDYSMPSGYTFYCLDGEIVSNCQQCGCFEGWACQPDGSCAEICSDGTLPNQCSVTKPKYCESGSLVDDCQKCGCPHSYVCSTNGTCIQRSGEPKIRIT
jgi:hypothetical protein